MGKVESIIKSEIIRLAKREVRQVSVPLSGDVRLLKNTVSQLRKSVLAIERFAAQERKKLPKQEIELKASAEEIKKSRFSPQLLKSLRKKLGITQKGLAVLTGVTLGAVQKWETGKFRPKNDKMAALVALRKLGRQSVRKLLE